MPAAPSAIEGLGVRDRCFIGGQWVGAGSGREFEVTDPATDEVLARVPDGDASDARQAIQAAAAAFPEWRDRTAEDRGRILRRMSELMLAQTERLARIMTLEQGKPLAEARGEIAYAASFLEWAADEGRRIYGETIPASTRDKRIVVLRQPVGVCAAITPWNFPSAMITRKLGPALAAGCTMVAKPAEQTPLSALALAGIGEQAGLPPGAFNVVTGDPPAIAGEFLADPTVRKLSFTGSTEVGKQLLAGAARNVTRISLELGGHAPFLVFDDADLEAAVAGAIACKYRNSGQTCICANRFLVQERIYDAFASRLEEEVRRLRVGRGLEEGVHVGPLIDDPSLEKVAAHVEDARARQARVRTGGRSFQPAPGLSTRFYEPTILEEVTGEMRVSREETFGPVAPLRRFRTEEEAVDIANDSRYGLAAYFYTRDASRVWRVAEALEYGIVGANDGRPSTVQAPFGGWKESGLGREGGRHVMEEYTELKFLSWGL